jgi:hypothetical protein
MSTMRYIANQLQYGFWAVLGGLSLVIALPATALADDFLKSCEEHPDGGWIDQIESNCKIAGSISGICVIFFALILLYGVLRLFMSIGTGSSAPNGSRHDQIRQDNERHQQNIRYNKENFG